MLQSRGSGLRSLRQLRSTLACVYGSRCERSDFVCSQIVLLPGGNMKKRFAILCITVLLAGLSVPAVFAQASGTVKGTCKDAEGNPVADALVVFANQDNGQKYTLKTNKKGEYFSLGLTPGKYNVTLY